MSGIRSYIIHLERATDRAAHVATLKYALPGEVEILPAVDARNGAVGTERYVPELGIAPRYPFALNPTEIAVFASHRKAWARIVEAQALAGLVVEDDVEVSPEQFETAMSLALEHMAANLVIRLPQKLRERGEVLASRNGARLVRPVVVGLGMQATLVGRDAAARLLRKTAQFDRPVDVALQMTWETGVDVLSAMPSGIRDISAELGGSTLKKRKGLLSRLRAERARRRFRRAMAERARR